MFTNFKEVETFFDSRKSLGIKPGLDRIKNLLQLLDNPQDRIRAIHIAGTNGKGSTLHYIKDALQANGYRVGVFTSPSFTDLTGYIFKGDKAIPEDTLVKICNDIYPSVMQLDNRNMPPTEFEIITALAFVYFSKHTDIALIEAGMGGREDTTNCFVPIISIITNVAKDHTAFLGNHISEIAYHKAGIIKTGAPVVVGNMEKEALDIIVEETRLKQTKCYQLGIDFTFKKAASGQSFQWSTSDFQIEASIQMDGEHQIKNASLAYMALVILSNKGFIINCTSAQTAINETQVPGRFETIHHQPLIILDGAHNPAGVQSFLDTVSAHFDHKEKHLMFAAFKDKDLKTMLDQLRGNFSSITLTSFNHPRAAVAKHLFDITRSGNKHCQPDWQQAIAHMLKKRDGIYFITGSLHFIALVREYLLSLSK